MDVTEHFVEVVGREPLPLDLCAIDIGRHGDGSCDPQAVLDELDRLATAVEAPTLDALVDLLFRQEGFRGDVTTYEDPVNSYLHAVLERRSGIPITLGVVMIEVGRRAGVLVEGVGAPGHFLVRSTGGDVRWVDGFGGGRILDRRGVVELFARLVPGLDVAPHLGATAPVDIVRRMLNNLVAAHQRRGDRAGLLWASRLRTLVPGATAVDRRSYAGALAATGDFAQAARVLESLAADVAPGQGRGDDATAASRLRARLN